MIGRQEFLTFKVLFSTMMLCVYVYDRFVMYTQMGARTQLIIGSYCASFPPVQVFIALTPAGNTNLSQNGLCSQTPYKGIQ